MENPMNMLTQFNQFKKSLQGQDPNKMLNDMISSGKVTQEQLNQAKELARQFQSLLK